MGVGGKGLVEVERLKQRSKMTQTTQFRVVMHDATCIYIMDP